jgi:hypothetical protein
MNFSWEILSVDPTTRTMGVHYQTADNAYQVTVNIPIPVEGQTAQQVVERAAPIMQLQPTPALPALIDVVVGTTGTATWAPTVISQSMVEDQIRTIVQQELAAQAAK